MIPIYVTISESDFELALQNIDFWKKGKKKRDDCKSERNCSKVKGKERRNVVVIVYFFCESGYIVASWIYWLIWSRSMISFYWCKNWIRSENENVLEWDINSMNGFKEVRKVDCLDYNLRKHKKCTQNKSCLFMT